jgi:hypothetical protein
MSYDALMRWEWEGGTPAFVTERDEAACAERAEGAIPRPQPANRHLRAPRVAAGARLPSKRPQSGGGER